uniref:MANSC domain containing 4 n=1 Tax=Hippocampus comes TaxID=109280 RepID=A0A3Q2YLX9_HIPCM
MNVSRALLTLLLLARRAESRCSPTSYYKNCWIRSFTGIVVDLEESERQGARLLRTYREESALRCGRTCCLTSNASSCNVAVFHLDAAHDNCCHLHCPTLESCIISRSTEAVLYNVTKGKYTSSEHLIEVQSACKISRNCKEGRLKASFQDRDSQSSFQEQDTNNPSTQSSSNEPDTNDSSTWRSVEETSQPSSQRSFQGQDTNEPSTQTSFQDPDNQTSFKEQDTNNPPSTQSSSNDPDTNEPSTQTSIQARGSTLGGEDTLVDSGPGYQGLPVVLVACVAVLLGCLVWLVSRWRAKRRSSRRRMECRRTSRRRETTRLIKYDLVTEGDN